MPAWNTTRAALASAGNDPLNFDRLAGAVDEQIDNPRAHDGQEFFDLRIVGIGLNEYEEALLRCTPVVCHEQTYGRVFGLGIFGRAICGSGPLDALAVDEVTFRDDGRFDFARDVGYSSHCVAVIIPVRNERCDLIDLAAWQVENGKLALWGGNASLIGAENVFAPRLGKPLEVHESIREWLRTGRQGVFVIDGRRAALLLHVAAPLGVRREAFGRRLRETLTIPAPRIVVSALGRRAA